jgi:hypothetical protein
LPGYAWRAMLKFTKIKLDLLTDVDMIDFFQSNSIRGGVSTVCELKLLKANNYMMVNTIIFIYFRVINSLKQTLKTTFYILI